MGVQIPMPGNDAAVEARRHRLREFRKRRPWDLRRVLLVRSERAARGCEHARFLAIAGAVPCQHRCKVNDEGGSQAAELAVGGALRTG